MGLLAGVSGVPANIIHVIAASKAVVLKPFCRKLPLRLRWQAPARCVPVGTDTIGQSVAFGFSPRTKQNRRARGTLDCSHLSRSRHWQTPHCRTKTHSQLDNLGPQSVCKEGSAFGKDHAPLPLRDLSASNVIAAKNAHFAIIFIIKAARFIAVGTHFKAVWTDLAVGNWFSSSKCKYQCDEQSNLRDNSYPQKSLDVKGFVMQRG